MSDVHAMHAAVVISATDTAYLLDVFDKVTQVATRYAPVPVRIPHRLNVLLQDMAEAAACAATCAQVPSEPELSDFRPDDLDTPKTAAQRLNTTESNVRQLCTRGTLAAMKRDGRWFISPPSVDEHKTTRTRKRA